MIIKFAFALFWSATKSAVTEMKLKNKGKYIFNISLLITVIWKVYKNKC